MEISYRISKYQNALRFYGILNVNFYVLITLYIHKTFYIDEAKIENLFSEIKSFVKSVRKQRANL